MNQSWAEDLSSRLGVSIVATNDVVCHAPQRQAVADVLNCIRRRTTLERAGRKLRSNAERYLLGVECFVDRYRENPLAIEESLRIASRCTFSLDQLRYSYPREIVPQGWSSIGWLRHLCELGLENRYPKEAPNSVKALFLESLKLLSVALETLRPKKLHNCTSVH